MTFKVKKNTLGSTVKYIDCAEVKSESVYNKMGELEVRFVNVCELTRDVTLEVRNTLGETDVYVPADWNVRVNMVNALGDIHVDEAFKVNRADESTLIIKANNKLGEINIKAI